MKQVGAIWVLYILNICSKWNIYINFESESIILVLMNDTLNGLKYSVNRSSNKYFYLYSEHIHDIYDMSFDK